MKIILTIALFFSLMGCGDQYRYPCQNPDNWKTERCQKPRCEVSRDCPEHVFKKTEKGACK